MQHKQDKNKHNNATMNCNDRGVNYQQSTISEDNTNNKRIRTMTMENANTGN